MQKANEKEALNLSSNNTVITPYTLGQVLNKKGASGAISSPDKSVSFVETVTKEELMQLQENNQLVPGTMYNIPDINLTEAEVYTDGLHTVVKYKDGRMEQYGLIQHGPKLITADYWGFCNRTDVTKHTFLEPFVMGTPVVNITSYSNVLTSVNITACNMTFFDYLGFAPKGAASTQTYFSIFYVAKGRWY